MLMLNNTLRIVNKNNFNNCMINVLKRNIFSSRFCYSSFSIENKMKIGTHDGVFHCDEVLACYMLKKLPEYKDAEIIRTRDSEKLKLCNIVVDVGAEFVHTKRLYDHHQREFTDTLSSLRPELGNQYNIKLSSAGLIYTYYGEQVIQALSTKKLSTENLLLIYKKIYENLIQEIDGIDNGVPMTEEEPKYRICTHISSRISRLNPEWNSEQTIGSDKRFQEAIKLVEEEFVHNLHYYTNVWLPARDFVQSAISDRFKTHPSGQILLFTERFPWKEHLFDLEKELGLGDQLKFVIFKDKPDSWRVMSVPVTPTSFVLRRALHAAWRGVRDDELSRVSGVPGAVFCHANGFIGGNRTQEGALRMAELSLQH